MKAKPSVHPIPTPERLRQINRRRDRHNRKVETVLTTMACGAALHLTYQNGRGIWQLTTGQFIPSETAAIVTAHPLVVAVDGGLLPNHPQTWRVVE
jgi:hypothetical protein